MIYVKCLQQTKMKIITINKYIESTLLKSDATQAEIKELCEEAMRCAFAAVCVNPYWAKYAQSLINKSSVKLCSVVGFPLGANTPEIKSAETRHLVASGAQEIDMVMNIGALKSQDYTHVFNDIQEVVKAAKHALVKVIIETSVLNEQEKKHACLISMEAGAHFVKTSTGFAKGGATVEDILLIHSVVGHTMGIKASGGVSDVAFAKELIEAGATRIGTSKASLLI